jgi:small subunit ribosomal protein S5
MSPKKTSKAKSEWSERVVAIERVTKVVKGGKKMSFRAIIVVGNEQGKVGVGVGKAGDVITAVRKGVTDGKKTYHKCSFNKFKFYTAYNKWTFWSSETYLTSIRTGFRCNRG